MRSHLAAKTFFYCSILTLLLLLYKSVMYSKYNYDNINVKYLLQINTERSADNAINASKAVEMDIKYILQWTSPANVPFVYMGEGRQGFIERNCLYTNCFVTANRSYLGDITKFDVITFSAPEVRYLSEDGVNFYVPIIRSPHQKYVFASIESADNYPLCSDIFNGYFNWTWTYRLTSEAQWGYIAIRDSNNNLVGPKINMNWIKLEDMDPVSEEIKYRIRNKTKAAAWFVSNCHSRSEREIFYRDLGNWLVKYNLKVDVFGDCGTLSCSRDNEEECNKMIEKDYYFYLSFENSFAEDYVTEKLLHPLKNYAVPIVYGGANYSRFMPDGIYLNARVLGAARLAEQMNELIENPNLYAEYFRWKKYYSYHRRSESIETDDYCRFCSILNEEDSVKTVSVYENIREWWDPPNRCY